MFVVLITGKMWWRGQYFKDAMSCLDPGYSPLPPFNNTIKMANEVRRGMLHLFRSYEFQNGGIRVLYSMPDMYAAYLREQKKGPANWLRTTQGMYKSIRHRGWQFDYVNPDQIEQGVMFVTSKKLKSLDAGKMGFATSKVGDMVVESIKRNAGVIPGA